MTDELQQCRAALAQAQTECRSLRVVVATMPTGVIVADARGEITLVNPAALGMLGDRVHGSVFTLHVPYTVHQLDGTPVPTDDLPIVRALRFGDVCRDVTLLIRDDRGERMLAVCADPIRDADGRITGAFATLDDVTARIRTEEALRDSETRFRAFAEATTEAIVLHEQGKILEVNQTLADHLGYAIPDMLGQSVLIFTAPESREAMIRHIQDEDPGPYLAFSLHKDGSRTIGEIRARQIMYRGRPVRVVAMRDITAQEQAKEALRASEAKFRSLFEHMSESVTIDELVFDESGRPVDWIIRDINPAYERIFQIPRERAVGQRATVLYPFIQSSPEEYEGYARRLEAGEEVLMELDDVHTGRHLLISAIPLGEHRFSTVSTDITERQRTALEREHLLLEVERRAEELDVSFAAINNPILLFDKEQTIIRTNPALTALIGQEMVGRTHAEMVRMLTIRHPDGEPVREEESPVKRARHGEMVRDIHVRITDAHGRDYEMLISASPLQENHNIWGVVSYWQDITALHALQEQQQALLQMVSHDLRLPLSVIKGYEQLVTDELKAQGVNGLIQQSLAAIDRGITRMDVMIQDLVDVTRWEGGQLDIKSETVALSTYIAELLQRIQMAMETLRIQVALPPDLPAVRADYARLERILVNLLSNALKYSDPDTPVSLSARQEDGHVVVAISDQGRGIPPAVLPHLFERFYRAAETRKAEGIGLGLYITRVLVEAHHGRLWVESEEGKGSTFFFTLPVAG